jgi:hypothetical protein
MFSAFMQFLTDIYQDNNISGPEQQSPVHSPPLAESSAAPQLSNHSGHAIHLPRQYADFILGDDIPEIPPPEDVVSEEREGDNLIPFQTEPNAMGLYRVYATHPTLFLPSSLNSLCDTPMLQHETSDPDNTPPRLHTGPPSHFPSPLKIYILHLVVQQLDYLCAGSIPAPT